MSIAPVIVPIASPRPHDGRIYQSLIVMGFFINS